jgi:hypothetical protein
MDARDGASPSRRPLTAEQKRKALRQRLQTGGVESRWPPGAGADHPGGREGRYLEGQEDPVVQ